MVNILFEFYGAPEILQMNLAKFLDKSEIDIFYFILFIESIIYRLYDLLCRYIHFGMTIVSTTQSTIITMHICTSIVFFWCCLFIGNLLNSNKNVLPIQSFI